MKRSVIALSALAGAAVLVFALRVGDSAAAGFLPYTDEAATARGAQIYADQCASCHGGNLQGQDDWQIRRDDGRMPAPPHDVSGHTWHHADELLFLITKYGSSEVVGSGYESDMIGFGEVLSDQDILDVLGFIKSTWPDEVVDQHNRINSAAN